MDNFSKFDAYKEIKDRSLFNIIPDTFHNEILDSIRLITLEKNQESKLNNLEESLYVVVHGEVICLEKDRKVDHIIKKVSSGRSLELENFIQGNQPEFDWKINETTSLLEFNKDSFFGILDKNPIFKSYLTLLLTNFELRKLKNDLRLFGFNEENIQKTFHCLQEHQGSLNEIDNSICIIKKAAITFYYKFENEEKVLGEFEKGDFFLWLNDRELDFEIDDEFQCWKLEYDKWINYIDSNDAKLFMELSDPLRGRIKEFKPTQKLDKNQLLPTLINKDAKDIWSKNNFKVTPSFKAPSKTEDADFFTVYNFIKSFNAKINLPYIKFHLPVGKESASLYSIQNFLHANGFSTHLGDFKQEYTDKIDLPYITKYRDENVIVYERNKHGLLAFIPSRGKSYIKNIEMDSLKNILLAKPINLPKTEKSKKTLASYLEIVKESKLELFFVILCSLLIFTFELITPIFTQIVFDEILISKDMYSLRVMTISAIVILFTSSLLVYIRSYLLTFLTTSIDIKFSSAFFMSLLKLNRKFYERFSAGHLISRINELKRIRKFFTAKTMKLLIDLISCIAFMTLISFYNIKLLYFILMLLPTMLIYVKLISPQITKNLNKLFENTANTQDYLIQHLQSANIIKSSNMQFKAQSIWSRAYEESIKSKKKLDFYNILLMVGSDFFMQIIPLLVTLYAIYLHINNELTLGQVIASSTIIGFIIYPIINLMAFVDDYKQIVVSFERVNDVVEAAREESSSNLDEFPNDIKEIKFKDITYKYGNENSEVILNGFNGQIKIGQNYGIVGSSGAGKSTLARLLVGKDEFLSGDILFDDVSMNSFSLSSIRESIVYVGSESAIFSGTIIENIALNSETTSLERVIEVAKISDAHSFITSLPNGYMTKLGEGGAGLSLGQKQRLSIARSLYLRPKVLILDEATSTLDLNSEKIIFQNIKDFMVGQTIIFISHRLEVVQNLDQILVLNHGQMVEEGQHNDLLLNQTFYFEMWNDATYSKT